MKCKSGETEKDRYGDKEIEIKQQEHQSKLKKSKLPRKVKKLIT